MVRTIKVDFVSFYGGVDKLTLARMRLLQAMRSIDSPLQRVTSHTLRQTAKLLSWFSMARSQWGNADIFV